MAVILVGDDDADARAVLQLMLSRAGYSVLTAPDGETVLRVTLDQAPDLLLLDRVMPGMDGHEVCRRLRADPRTDALPILLMSAQSLHADMQAGLDAGADDYLLKPFRTQDLLSRVEALLRRPR